MATRTVKIGEIDDVKLVKRRGARTIRLSITNSGAVRIGLPYFMPYAAGVLFAKNNMAWIIRQRAKHQRRPLMSGALIASRYRLLITSDPSLGTGIRTRVKEGIIEVKSPWAQTDQRVQQKTVSACEKALKIEAERVLPRRLSELANQHGFKHSKVRIRKLTSRWGSCSSKGNIALSIFLVQLPAELIDYVILHELMHTRHLNHSSRYWQELELILPATKQYRKLIKTHKPHVEPA